MGAEIGTVGKSAELTALQRELMLVNRHYILGIADNFRGENRLERSAYILLSRIEVEGPMSIGQLAEAFGLDTSTVNRQTAAMLRAGVAERIPDPAGGIARKLRITAEGRKRLHEEREWATDGLRRLLEKWTPAEINQLIAALTHFNESIEEVSGKPWPRSRTQ
jgi:DNA-binding MarR family transcriptional regulator